MGSIIRRIEFGKISIVYLFGIWLTSQIVFAQDILTVCDTCALRTVQSALDAAPAGATVQVLKGIYKEKTINITKPVKLIGVDNPILDGQNHQQILVIYKTKDVVVSGFTFKDTGLSFTAELAGLRVIESANCEISKNSFYNTTYGIYLEKSDGCLIKDNQFQAFSKDEASGGNGIHVWTGSTHTITGNKIQGHRDGIYLEFVKSSSILNNDVFFNLRYGLHFMFSNNTHAYENQFHANGSGVAIMYSQDIEMKKNSYYQNKGTASYGLLLKDIHSSHIEENQFYDNTVAIYMEGSNRSKFLKNVFSSNGYGLRIMGNCENNHFENNDFSLNNFDVTTNSSMSWNTFINNFWSKYLGYDLDKDGLGDTPFRPVSLSSIVIESFDSSYFLLGSFLFDLLDFVERALPELIPEPLLDEHPLMIKPKTISEASNDKN